jgi:hypothetical protein
MSVDNEAEELFNIMKWVSRNSAAVESPGGGLRGSGGSSPLCAKFGQEGSALLCQLWEYTHLGGGRAEHGVTES